MREVVCQLSGNLFQPPQPSKRFPAPLLGGLEKGIFQISLSFLGRPLGLRLAATEAVFVFRDRVVRLIPREHPAIKSEGVYPNCSFSGIKE